MRGNVMLKVVLVAAGCAALAGCSNNMGDLKAYIASVKARPGGRIPPLPQIQPAPKFTYVPGGRRSPFKRVVETGANSSNPNAVNGPDPDRPREFLEQFPLDTMKMVGTLSIGGKTYGLIQTADGQIHRVHVGNYIGQNYGRITSITQARISLVEIVPDGLGGYIKRPTAIALSDQ